MTILPSVTFGNVYWYSLLMQGKNVVIDPYENFVKQSYRSRFEIVTSQGTRFLSVPVKSQNGIKTPLAKIQIFEDDYWKSQHLKSIESAYNSSPFYLFYQDELKALYARKHTNLHEFNIASVEMISNCLDLDFSFQVTTSYIDSCLHDFDARPLLKPSVLKKYLNDNPFNRYIQVFEPKLGFQSNLSILDLLFNLGPEAEGYLEEINMEL